MASKIKKLLTAVVATVTLSSAKAHALDERTFNSFRQLQSAHAKLLLSENEGRDTKEFKELMAKISRLLTQIIIEIRKAIENEDKEKLRALDRDLVMLQDEAEKINSDTEGGAYSFLREILESRATIHDKLNGPNKITLSLRGGVYTSDLKKIKLDTLYGFRGGVYMFSKDPDIAMKFREALKLKKTYPYTEIIIVHPQGGIQVVEWVGYGTHRENPNETDYMVTASDISTQLPTLPVEAVK